jgi:hypothetical protein
MNASAIKGKFWLNAQSAADLWETEGMRLNCSPLAFGGLEGARRRAFMAEMALQYCGGSARLAATVFGWGRETVAVGLAEKRTGLICFGAQSACCGH